VSYPLALPNADAEGSGGWGAYAGTFAKSRVRARSGSNAMQFLPNLSIPQPSIGGDYAAGAPVTPGQRYTASAWVQSPVGRSVAASLVFVDASNAVITVVQGATVNAPADQWVQVTASGVAPPGAAKATVRVWMLESVATAPVLNPNAGLETGTKNGWTGAFAPSYLTNAFVHSGAMALRWEPNTGSNSSVENDFTGTAPATVGEVYTVSGWAYAPVGTPQIEIGLMWWNASGVYRGRQGGTLVTVPQGVWTKVSTTLVVPDVPADITRAGVRLGRSPEGSVTTYIDDLEIRQADVLYVDDLELRTSALYPYRLTGGALVTETPHRLVNGSLT
jgi:hypothetical protein